MANQQAWDDKKTIININEAWKKCFYDITVLFQEAQKLKSEVLDNPARVTELKKILATHPAEDPNWEIAEIQTLYGKIKSAHDFVIAPEG